MKFRPRGDEPVIRQAPLPYLFKKGDPVIVYFGQSAIIKNCTVIKIHFGENVSYDVEVKWKHIESAGTVRDADVEREFTHRLYNLWSGVVLSPDDFEKENMKPEDVFDNFHLHKWAQENGYAKPMVKDTES